MAMMTRRFGLIFVAISLMFLATACSPSDGRESAKTPNQAKVQSYVHAYNARNIDAMADLMHADIEWINIEGSTQSIVTEYKETLVLELTRYFSTSPQSVSSLSDWSETGKFVSVKETVAFTREDGTQGSQASLSTYEFENDLIRRVWYFPAE